MANTKDFYFDEIYRQSYRKIFNFARRLCGNHDQAEDITQEAFVRAYNAIESCESNVRVDNWLMKIVYNIFLDSKRRASRRVREISETSLDEEGLAQFPDSARSVEDLMTLHLDTPILKVIETLSADQKELLRLAFVERMSHRDIAAKMGVQTGTARSRIHRLCVQIRKSTALNSEKKQLTPAFV